MAPRKEEAPSVTTFGDHEVITPTHELRRVIGPGTDGDPVARAEAALATLSSEFGNWMQAECQRLETARQNVKRQGFTEKTFDELFRTAHDIKGEAVTFGFPEAAGVAESLCRLLEHSPEAARIPMQLLDAHVDSIRAITREHARVDVAAVAGTLRQRLREVTDDYLRQENEFRPDYLESIFSPSLVPGS